MRSWNRLTNQALDDLRIKSMLAMLAMLMLLSISLHAQNTPTNTVLILTAEQQKKLATLTLKYGHDTALSLQVTAALGIGKSDDVQTLRELTTNDHPNLHAYIPLPDGGILFLFVDTTAAWSYRLDAKLKLIAAVSKKSEEGAPVVIPKPDAERNIQIELAYWAAVADKH